MNVKGILTHLCFVRAAQGRFVVAFLCREGAKCDKAAAMPCNHEDGVLKRRCAVLGNPQPTRLLAGFHDSRHRPCFYEIALREAKSAEVGCSEIGKFYSQDFT